MQQHERVGSTYVGEVGLCITCAKTKRIAEEDCAQGWKVSWMSHPLIPEYRRWSSVPHNRSEEF